MVDYSSPYPDLSLPMHGVKQHPHGERWDSMILASHADMRGCRSGSDGGDAPSGNRPMRKTQ